MRFHLGWVLKTLFDAVGFYSHCKMYILHSKLKVQKIHARAFLFVTFFNEQLLEDFEQILSYVHTLSLREISSLLRDILHQWSEKEAEFECGEPPFSKKYYQPLMIIHLFKSKLYTVFMSLACRCSPVTSCGNFIEK